MKEKYDHRLLLKHLPSDFKQFMEHLQVKNEKNFSIIQFNLIVVAGARVR